VIPQIASRRDFFMGTEDLTSQTLLGRLRNNPNDQKAWSEFVERYGVVIYRWCRKWRLQESDAEDVTQNVMLDIGRQMRTFEYRVGGRFRAWLRTVAHRAWCDFLSARQRATPGSGDTAVGMMLSSVPASEEFIDTLDAECERELLDAAMALVQIRVEQQTWEAFILTAIQGVGGTETAERLNMPVASVYQAKSRIQKLLQAEVERLDNGGV
jgi:RNA polymerase sigma-70 factor (ECF subfamily)